MNLVETKELTPVQKEAIRRLWNKEYPAKLALATPKDMDDFLSSLTDPGHYLLADDKGNIYAWAAVFIRDQAKWFVIIIDSMYKKHGLGRMLLNRLKQNNTVLNGWVIDHDKDLKQNGEAYLSPLGFYLKNGFTVHAATRLELDKISAVKISWSKRPVK
jgi:hypothetical protein